MTRQLTTAMASAVSAAAGTVAYLVTLEFSGGTERLTTGPNDIAYDGDTYTAVGGHLHFETVQEGAELAGSMVRLTLDGVDQTIITHLLGESYIGRQATIHRVHLGTDGAIVADPIVLFQSYLNQAFDVQETDGTCRVRTALVSPFAKLAQSGGCCYRFAGLRASPDAPEGKWSVGEATATLSGGSEKPVRVAEI